MKKLTDIYIKVTKGNVEELMKQINRYDLEPHSYVFFVYDSIKGNEIYFIEPKNRKKVTLAELKRLIDTIPTREEIKRLKQQISAYKTNYDKVVKHSLSKEDELEFLRSENESLKNIILTLEKTNNYLYDKKDVLLKENAQLKQRKWWHIW